MWDGFGNDGYFAEWRFRRYVNQYGNDSVCFAYMLPPKLMGGELRRGATLDTPNEFFKIADFFYRGSIFKHN
jgi:hypothetical protein